MTTRTHRSPAELIAETEARLAALRVREAKQAALSDPTLAPLVAKLDAVRGQIREARKGLGSGPQSFAARLAKHEAWINKINAEKAEAQEVLDTAETLKAQIETELTAKIEAIANASA